MPEFIVTTLNQKTGEQSTRQIQASDSDNAVRLAGKDGHVVEACERAPAPPPNQPDRQNQAQPSQSLPGDAMPTLFAILGVLMLLGGVTTCSATVGENVSDSLVGAITAIGGVIALGFAGVTRLLRIGLRATLNSHRDNE